MSWITKVLSDKRFLWVIVAIVVIQALWFAVSFRPWINDESQHFRLTEIYTQQASPFISEQPTSWDEAGQVTRNGSYLFYYAMSWPLRLLQTVSDDTHMQLLGLRLMMIAVFVGGLIMYARALSMIKQLSTTIINVILLIFVLMPTAGLLAGMYNYDVAVFALIGLMLYVAILLLQRKTTSVRLLTGLILLAGVAMLVKWTSVALVVPMVAYVAYDQWRRFGAGLFDELWRQFRGLHTSAKIALVLGLVVVSVITLERPVQNFATYGRVNPSCDMVIGKERCQKYRTYFDYQQTLADKDPDFEPLPAPFYVARYWVPRMADTATNLYERAVETRLPVAFVLYLFGAVVSMIVVLAKLRSIWRVREFRMFFLIGAAYVVALLVDEYLIYTKYGIPGAIRARYLVPILPLYFAVVAYGIWPLVRQCRKYSSVAVVVFLLVFVSQGGGIVSHLVASPERAYISKEAYDVNQSLRSVVKTTVFRPPDTEWR